MSESVGSRRGLAMAKYLPQNGIEVAVLTYRSQAEEVSFGHNLIGVRDYPGILNRLVSFGRNLIGLPDYAGVLKRFWHDTVLKHSDEIIDHIKPDAIFASYPLIEALEIGIALSEKYQLPLISDFRDGLLFESLEADKLLCEANLLYYQAVEAQTVLASKLILTVSEPISSYFRDHYAHSNVRTLHNGFDPNDIAPDTSFAMKPDVINIVHTGRLELSRLDTAGRGRGVDALSTSLQILSKRSPEIMMKLNFHFVGQLSQPEHDCLAPFVSQGIVYLWGQQSRAIALGFQTKADVLLLITAPDMSSIATGKLFEYLAANKPILALTRGTEAERIVRETGSGVTVSPDEPEAIAEAIATIVLNQGIILAERQEQVIAGFSRNNQMAILATMLKQL